MKFISFQKIAITLTASLSCLSVTAVAADNVLSEKEKADGWQLLFDGKTTTGWAVYQKAGMNSKWRVENGTLALEPGGGDISTRKSYKDFEFQCEWKISENGNSGIFVRVDDSGKAIWSKSIEMQVLDNSEKTKAKHKAGSIYDLVAAPEKVAKKVGEWNHVKILCKGKQMTFWLNGTQTASFEIGSKDWNDRLANSKFKNWEGFGLAPSGPIGLQDHGNPVWFKNLKIRELN